MTQEDIQLLLKDLSARLTYGVIVHICSRGENAVRDVILSGDNITNAFEVPEGWWKEIKPYLRPMSSITTDEEYEYYQIKKRNSDKSLSLMDCSDHLRQLLFPIIVGTESIDWLNAHHFDYRGLIEKGLALEAPEGMYKEK